MRWDAPGQIGEEVGKFIKFEDVAIPRDLATDFVNRQFGPFPGTVTTYELRQVSTRNDPLGGTQLLYQHYVGGVPIYDEVVRVDADPSGQVTSVIGRAIPPEVINAVQALSPTTRISEDTAVQIAAETLQDRVKVAFAKKAFKANATTRPPASDPPRLYYYPFEGRTYLAWRTVLSVVTDTGGSGPTDITAWAIWINAKDGQVLTAHDLLGKSDEVPDGSGISSNGRTRRVPLQRSNNKVYLLDRDRKIRIFRKDIGTPASGDSSKWDDQPDTSRDASRKPEVDAIVYFGMAYDYFVSKHKRPSYDGNASEINVITHHSDPAMAAWYPKDKLFLFGDGDGKRRDFMTGDITIAGHEYAHAVMDSVVKELGMNLGECAYTPGEEKRALSESFADVFGLLTAEYAEDRLSKDKVFRVGEAVFLDGTYRDLADPKKGKQYNATMPYEELEKQGLPQPTSYHEIRLETCRDRPGVAHVNSGIPSRVLYLLLTGGTSNGFTINRLGPDKVGQLLYLTIFELFPPGGFNAAYRAMWTAARKLWPENRLYSCTVNNAWVVVGVEREPCYER